eukprot:Tamp_23749.p1 GENE.Tamp_23749~~Tamp_23749.p1  ORF type:complete len:100 (-),score=3.16 Tamp_23749:399-698(-)
MSFSSGTESESDRGISDRLGRLSDLFELPLHRKRNLPNSLMFLLRVDISGTPDEIAARLQEPPPLPLRAASYHTKSIRKTTKKNGQSPNEKQNLNSRSR